MSAARGPAFAGLYCLIVAGTEAALGEPTAHHTLTLALGAFIGAGLICGAVLAWRVVFGEDA